MEKRRPQTIKKIFPITNGIFNHIPYTFREGISKNNLDLLFIANYGQRNPAPIVELVQDSYGAQLTNEELTALGLSIAEMYSDRWDRLSALLDIEYDPIHNYLDEFTKEKQGEVEENVNAEYGKHFTHGKQITKSELRTDDLSEEVTYGRTSTRTDNLTESQEGSTHSENTGNTVDSVWGFNSSSNNNANKSENTSETSGTSENEIVNTGTQSVAVTGSDTTENTGTQSKSGSEIASGTDVESSTEDATTSTTSSGSEESRHFGNIGNITSQKQLKEEIELWRWKYMNAILDDVKEFLTIPAYLTHFTIVDDDDMD